MKLKDMKKPALGIRAPAQRSRPEPVEPASGTLGVQVFVPTQRTAPELYQTESITLALGTCPLCGKVVSAEFDHGKVIYQCQGDLYHQFVRDALH